MGHEAGFFMFFLNPDKNKGPRTMGGFFSTPKPPPPPPLPTLPDPAEEEKNGGVYGKAIGRGRSEI